MTDLIPVKAMIRSLKGMGISPVLHHDIIKAISEDQEMSDAAYSALFHYYCKIGAIPYGVAKARDGDPVVWVERKLKSDWTDYRPRHKDSEEVWWFYFPEHGVWLAVDHGNLIGAPANKDGSINLEESYDVGESDGADKYEEMWVLLDSVNEYFSTEFKPEDFQIYPDHKEEV